MIRLALSEVIRDFPAFAALVVAQTVAGIWVGLSTYFVSSIYSPTGQATLAHATPGSTSVLTQIDVFMLFFGILIPSAFVVAALGASRIALARTRLARWRLAGASPAQVASSILVQSAVLGAAFGALGACFAIPLSQGAIDALLRVSDVGVAVPTTPTARDVFLVAVFVMITSVVGSWRPALRAARVSAIEALISSSAAERRLGWPLIAIWVLLVLASVGTAASTLGEKYNGAASASAVVFGALILVTIGAAGSHILPKVLTGWTALIPSRRLPAWYLARHSASARLSVTTSAVLPFMLGAGLLGVYFSDAQTWAVASNASGARAELVVGQGIILFVPTVVIAVVGSIATITMSGRARSRENALVRALGVSPGSAAGASLCEAFMYAMTALLLAGTVSALSALLYATSLSMHGYRWSFQLDLRGAAAASVLGFVGLALSLSLPRVREGKHLAAKLALDT
jgi:putative ABC transport system permease protein